MPDLRARLGELNVKLPLCPSSDPAETGVVQDADGRAVLTVDVDNERPDRAVDAIAAAVAEAVNAAAQGRGGVAVKALTHNDLADAFECVWNAAIGESHRRQSGIDTASIIAESFAAMARRLRELAAAERRQVTKAPGYGNPFTDDEWQDRLLRDEAALGGAEGATGRAEIAHDGFAGDIIGHYVTREGKRGVVVQQDGTRVVHVYGEKWLPPSPALREEVNSLATSQPAVGEASPSIADRVRSIVSDFLGRPVDEITEQMSFIDDLGADSLDLVELVMAYEQEFNLEISDRDAGTLLIVGDAIRYVEKAVRG